MMGTTTLTGTCPKCDGSTRRPVPPDYNRSWLPNIYGYDEATDTFPCNNCGGQTMAGRGTGTVLLRDDGTPCLHEYTHINAGRCLHKYVCKYCPHTYYIDSGD